jgi:UDP-glucose 4-epimerase
MTSIEKILVTGANGLLGSYCVRALHGHGYDVVAMYHKDAGQSLPWKWRATDLAASAIDEVSGEVYSTIVHCAAKLPVRESELKEAAVINRNIDENITEYAKRHGSRVIYMSGTSVYGCTAATAHEDSAVEPAGEYVLGKYESEQRITRALGNYVIMRVSAPYGAGQRSRTVLRIFIENAQAGQPLKYYGSGSREQDFTHADDVARAVINCIERPTVSGVFNICSGQAVSMRELADIVKKAVGSNSEIVAAGVADPQEGCGARYSIEKARTLLNWSPAISLEQGIQSLINANQ